MKQFNFINKKIVSLSLVALLALTSLNACQNKPKPQTAGSESVSGTENSSLTSVDQTKESQAQTASSPRTFLDSFLSSAPKNAAYLENYFALKESAYDAKNFALALSKVTGDADINNQASEAYKGLATSLEADFTLSSLFKALVQASGNLELAEVYSANKTRSAIDKVLTNSPELLAKVRQLPEADLAYLATALNCNLLNEKLLAELFRNYPEQKITTIAADIANELLMRVSQFSGTGRQFLADTADTAAGGKLLQAWNNFLLIQNDTLNKLGNEAVRKKFVTGFNIKLTSYDSKFLSSNTLRYGHSDIKHALQLVNLLRSEGIEALINLEPKVSLFEYLLDWGPIPQPSPTYRVDKIADDFYVTAALEYDLEFEFISNEDLQRFNSLILEYAKKSSEDADGKGLLYASWWQPLYSSTDLLSPENYSEMTDCIVRLDNYELHTFCMPEDTKKVSEFLKANLQVDATVSTETRYANNAFINYLSGSDYQ